MKCKIMFVLLLVILFGVNIVRAEQPALDSFDGIIVTSSCPEDFVIGQPAKLTVTLKNERLRPIYYPWRSKECSFISWLYLCDANGCVSYSRYAIDATRISDAMRNVHPEIRELKPGEEITFTTDISKYFDIKKPGTYQLKIPGQIYWSLGTDIWSNIYPFFLSENVKVLPKNSTPSGKNSSNLLKLKCYQLDSIKANNSMGDFAYSSLVKERKKYDLRPEVEIMKETYNPKELMKLYPNAIIGDGAYMFIPQTKSDGTFTGFKAIKVWKGKDKDGEIKFYILKGSRRDMTMADMPLYDKKPMSDSGPGNYTVLFATAPWGAKLYEANWELGPSGNGVIIREHPFYLLQSPDGKWLWGGKGPEYTFSGKSSSCTGYNVEMKTQAHWGSPNKQGWLSFERSTTCWDTGGGGPARETLVTYSGPMNNLQLGMSYRPHEIRPAYFVSVRAKEGDTVDTIARRVAIWERGYTFTKESTDEQAKENEKIFQRQKSKILKLNPDILKKPIKKGQGVCIEKLIPNR